jgi:hypothetical protein
MFRHTKVFYFRELSLMLRAPFFILNGSLGVDV